MGIRIETAKFLAVVDSNAEHISAVLSPSRVPPSTSQSHSLGTTHGVPSMGDRIDLLQWFT